MADHGLKISQPGYDVKTAIDKRLIFSSAFPCLKFIQLGRRDFTINSGNTTVYEQDITTPLPFMPVIYIWNPQLSQYKPASQDGFPNYFSDFLHCYYEFTSTKLYVTVSNFTGANRTTHYIWGIGYA